MHGGMFAQLELREGDHVTISQGGGSAVLAAVRDDRLPENCVRVPAAHPLTAGLGGMFGALVVTRALSQQKVAV